MNKVSIAIHGGAGTILKTQITSEQELRYKKTLEQALHEGHHVLRNNGSSLDAVEMAVMVLEDSHLFNAGKGSVFNADGNHEMDAAIMDGRNLDAGAVAIVDKVKNPIVLARKIMEESEHVLLAGKGALKFAQMMDCKLEDKEYFFDELRFQQWLEVKDSSEIRLDHSEIPKERKFGTVGAVAVDAFGNVAAATSTGGMTNKNFGRVGDSAVIGSGTYANNKTCAISCTGSGEFFIRGTVAYDVSCLMEYKGYSLKEACEEVIAKKMIDLGGDGGLVGVDSKGNISMNFNTEGMYRGSININGELEVSIYK